MSAPESSDKSRGAWAPISGGRDVGPNRIGGAARRHDQQPIHQVAQLTDIARPIIGLKCSDRIRRQFARRHACAFSAARRRKYSASIGTSSRRWRKAGTCSGTTAQAVDRDPPETARPTISACRSRFVVAMTRTSTLTRDDPFDPLKGLVLQGANDLALGLQRHIRHLIEQQRPAMGPLENPSTARLPARSIARLNPEQLLLETSLD